MARSRFVSSGMARAARAQRLRFGLALCLLSAVALAGCVDVPPGGGTGGGAGGGGGDLPPPPAGTMRGCDDTVLLETPDDPAERGPWPVGVRTVAVPLPSGKGDLNVEVFYPAVPGSEDGVARAQYDIREFLPEGANPIPDEAAVTSWSECDCYRDLPIDAEHGPYPGVLHIHGTAAFRVASRAQLTHWASRGFVAYATDHPGMYLGDMLALADLWLTCDSRGLWQNVDRDVDAMIAAMNEATGELAFLDGVYDSSRIAIMGHSQGAGIAAGLSDRPGVRMIVSMAGGSGVDESDSLESVLVLGGMSDALIDWDSQLGSYEDSPGPKRLVGLANAGHLIVTDLCGSTNTQGQDALEVATEYDICGIGLAGSLWDCDPSYLGQAIGTEIVNYATTAALEETLHCRDRDAAFAEMESRYPDVGANESAL